MFQDRDLEFQGSGSGLEASNPNNNTIIPYKFHSSSFGGAYGYSLGNTSDTVFMPDDVTYEDQASAIGNGAMTENLITSSDPPPGGAYGYSRDNTFDTIFDSNDVTYEDQTFAIGNGGMTENLRTSVDPSPSPMEAVNYSVSGPSLPLTNDTTNACACIPCFVKSKREFINYTCVIGCDYRNFYWGNNSKAHLKTHFKEDKKFHCRAPLCGQIFGRWGELTRHYKTHCLRPKKFACDVFGCRYSGDNGFIRHDKLLSHKRNVHDGKAPPSQLMRRLQAKPRA